MDLDSPLAVSAIAAALRDQKAEVERLAAEVNQLDGWCTNEALPADLRAYLAARGEELRKRIGLRLIEWRLAGFTIHLTSPPVQETVVPSPPASPDAPVPIAVPPAPVVASPPARPAVLTWTQELQVVLDRLLPADEGPDEFTLILATITGFAGWTDWPDDVKNDLCSFLMARMRALEREVRTPVDLEGFLDGLRLAQRMYRGIRRIHGFEHKHQPRGEKWKRDAEELAERLKKRLPAPSAPNKERMLGELAALVDQFLVGADASGAPVLLARLRHQIRRLYLVASVSASDRRLIRITEPVLDHLTSTDFESLRRKIRAYRAELEEDLTEDEETTLGDWPFLEQTRGRAVIVVGGTDRPHRRERIQRAFGFASIDWYGSDHTRLLQKARERVEGGTVQFVILLKRFTNHDIEVLMPLCRERNIPCANVHWGVGVQGIRLAMERMFDPTGAQAK